MAGGTAILENESGETPDDLPYVIEGDQVSTFDMVYSYTRDEKLTGYGDYACGIEGVGKLLPIQAEGTIIKEVGDLPAEEWYAGLLGKERLERDPLIATAFPITMKKEKDLAYHVAYMTDAVRKKHYLQTYPELKDGSKVSAGFFNPQKIYEQVSEVINRLSKLPCESIFIYDCHARAGLLSNCAHWEIENFRSTNASGALLSGEVISKGNEIFYANYTFVVVALSEDSTVFPTIKVPKLSSVQMLQEENIQTLSYLWSNSNRMLTEELRAQRSLVESAVFLNPTVGIYNQLKFQSDTTTLGIDKVAMLRLENEKMLTLFSGVNATYAFLSKCYQKIRDTFLKKALFVYSYQDTSLLVATTAEIDENTFEKNIDDIFELLNNTSYEEILLSYTAVTYYGIDDSITGLEMALDYAHNHNSNRVRYKEFLQDFNNKNGHHQMLWILREALAHRRIMPYYQEIHSNIPGKRKLYEALMRIVDSSGKVYFPDQFLPVSKEFALYDSISELMVGYVMDFFKDKNCRVSINLNVQDIYNRKMLLMIFEKMKKATHPGNYVFEIVESEAVCDYEYITNFVDRIHSLGGKIAIDDFGSGYSNLMHLLSLNADYIKIDGAIIKSIKENPRCKYLVEFMQMWCQKNNLALVCEYVEDKYIQDIMEELNVAYSQGYYFSKPHPWEE